MRPKGARRFPPVPAARRPSTNLDPPASPTTSLVHTESHPQPNSLSAYDYVFLDVVEAVRAWEAAQADKGAHTTFYYFDLLVVNQHLQDAVVPFEVLRDEFSDGVRSIGRTLLVLKWDNPVPLRRAWCVFEIGITLAHALCFDVIMPPQDRGAFLAALTTDFAAIARFTCDVDVERASAREPRDLVNIQRTINEGHGEFCRRAAS